MQFQYFIPTRILFGKGELSNLHKQQLPGKKALIVTSAGNSVKKYGYLSRLEEQLELAGVSHVLFDKILPNPIKEHVMEGAALARENGCDFVIGLGGGSSIDSAKAVAVMAANDGDYWDYISGGSGKGKELLGKPLPIVAITTTAGTGTEADPFAVVRPPAWSGNHFVQLSRRRATSSATTMPLTPACIRPRVMPAPSPAANRPLMAVSIWLSTSTLLE